MEGLGYRWTLSAKWADGRGSVGWGQKSSIHPTASTLASFLHKHFIGMTLIPQVRKTEAQGTSYRWEKTAAGTGPPTRNPVFSDSREV